MANQYEKYLNRLRNIKTSRPEMQVYERNMAKLAEPYNILNRKMAQMTQAGGASTAAQVAALNEGRQQWNTLQQDNYSQALGAASQREERIDTKIAEVEFQNDQYKDQQRREKSAKRTGALRTALSGIGMAAGAALAIPTGGMSMLAGAALGGAIGQTASGFMGINKDGNLSLDPEEWDTGVIEQGLTSAVTQLATNASQRETRDKLGLINDQAGGISRFIQDNPDAAPVISFQIMNTLENGSFDDLMSLISQITGGNYAY
jgi:hypothetical protein